MIVLYVAIRCAWLGSYIIFTPSFRSFCHTCIIAAKLGDLQSAVQSFERSLELAKLLDDELSQEAIKKALDEVNAQIVGEIKQDNENMDSEAVPA